MIFATLCIKCAFAKALVTASSCSVPAPGRSDCMTNDLTPTRRQQPQYSGGGAEAGYFTDVLCAKRSAGAHIPRACASGAGGVTERLYKVKILLLELYGFVFIVSVVVVYVEGLFYCCCCR